jgi:hypothetical protein
MSVTSWTSPDEEVTTTVNTEAKAAVRGEVAVQTAWVGVLVLSVTPVPTMLPTWVPVASYQMIPTWHIRPVVAAWKEAIAVYSVDAATAYPPVPGAVCASIPAPEETAVPEKDAESEADAM